MIYIIMSTILVIAIIFILFGVITANEETKNNDDKGANTNDTEPSDKDGSEPTPESQLVTPRAEPKVKVAVRKTATKRRVQPSTKRTSGGVKKRVSKKTAVK